MNDNRRSYVWEALKGLSIGKLLALYSEMRTFLSITARKKNNFSPNVLQKRIEMLDKYQNDLKTLSEIHIATTEQNFHLEEYLVRQWAIEKYHNFLEQRNKYGI